MLDDSNCVRDTDKEYSIYMTIPFYVLVEVPLLSLNIYS